MAKIPLPTKNTAPLQGKKLKWDHVMVDIGNGKKENPAI